MANEHVLSASWREELRHAALYVFTWHAAAGPLRAALEIQLTYAMQLGKPIRIARLDPTPVPEDLCVGYADIQTAWVTSAAHLRQQCLAWLADLPEQTP